MPVLGGEERESGSETNAGEIEKRILPVDVYPNIPVDQAVPLFVTVELEDGVEDEECEHARDEEQEYSDVHEPPPCEAVLPDLPLLCNKFSSPTRIQLVESRIILVRDQTIPSGRKRRVPM
jgi:hypothetical protein